MSEKRPKSKYKIDRRLGCNLWGRPKSPYNLRQTAPGMHGARRAKPTEYGIQLFAKQKLKVTTVILVKRNSVVTTQKQVVFAVTQVKT